MNPLLSFDKTMGDAVERLVRGHHHRRLRKVGWNRALEPPDDGLWAAGDPPPRDGNAIEKEGLVLDQQPVANTSIPRGSFVAIFVGHTG